MWLGTLFLVAWRGAFPLLAISATAAKATEGQLAEPSGTLQAFRELCAAKAAECEKREEAVVPGQDGWLFLGSALRHASLEKFWGEAASQVCRAQKPEWADPLPAIVKFNADLQELGIALVVVPVPPKVFTYPDKLDPQLTPEPRLDVGLRTFAAALQEQKVRVLDLLPSFIAARADDEKLGPVYCRTDVHYSPRGVRLTAQAIAAELKKQPWYATVPKQVFATQEEELQITGDLVRLLGEKGLAWGKEKLPFLRVGRKVGGQLQRIEPDLNSPVLLLGDSHTLVFHDGGDLHATHGGLPDLLALELGFPVDLLGIRGSAATTVRLDLYTTAREDPTWLCKKKIIVYCFTSRELTEAVSGWRPLPVVKKGG
jgi:alginate O-acetyltransferase complex protein AlgJ